jgi:hypothetical protein
MRRICATFHCAGKLLFEQDNIEYFIPGSIPGHYKKKVVGLERGPLSLVSTTEELLDRKVAAPV